MEKKKLLKCSECGYCCSYRPANGSRHKFFCKHPGQRFIYDYFARKGMRKMPGFLGSSPAGINKVPLKTSPAWCPERQDAAGTESEAQYNV